MPIFWLECRQFAIEARKNALRPAAALWRLPIATRINGRARPSHRTRRDSMRSLSWNLAICAVRRETDRLSSSFAAETSLWPHRLSLTVRHVIRATHSACRILTSSRTAPSTNIPVRPLATPYDGRSTSGLWSCLAVRRHQCV